MTIKIGINGFGRIGRSVFRAIAQNPSFKDVSVVAINDPVPKATLIHLLKYDSVMGVFAAEVAETDKGFSCNGKEVAVYGTRVPAEIPWGSHGADFVVESTGFFVDKDSASGHIKGGAKRVIISAPAKGDVKTMVVGVNEHEYNPSEHTVVSNASCTTNCLAPFAKVIHDKFGIECGLMTTTHAYTGDQSLVDAPHSDMRRARAAAVSMIPTKTGAAAAIGLVMPDLKGRFDGLAIRVPTPNVSIVDAVMQVKNATSVEEVNKALRSAADNRILGYTDEPLVSIDFKGDPRSSIVDGGCTRVTGGGKTVKVMSWYDNEWGYSNRVVDLIKHMQKVGI
jgi:glyceraldehyde 3-phosphate dehydrogenase